MDARQVDLQNGDRKTYESVPWRRCGFNPLALARLEDTDRRESYFRVYCLTFFAYHEVAVANIHYHCESTLAYHVERMGVHWMIRPRFRRLLGSHEVRHMQSRFRE